MAFIRVEPVEVQVRTDWFSGRPREITWGDERLPITRLAAIREEASAYPVISGHRSRRWTVTGMDDEVRRRRVA